MTKVYIDDKKVRMVYVREIKQEDVSWFAEKAVIELSSDRMKEIADITKECNKLQSELWILYKEQQEINGFD